MKELKRNEKIFGLPSYLSHGLNSLIKYGVNDLILLEENSNILKIIVKTNKKITKIYFLFISM